MSIGNTAKNILIAKIVYINIYIKIIIAFIMILKYLKIYLKNLNMIKIKEDIIAKNLLANERFKSIMSFGTTIGKVTVHKCPVCKDNHINAEALYDDDEGRHFYIKCPSTNVKVIGIYA